VLARATPEDRRFYSRLGIVFGPLFVLGGFLAAFTIMGAVMIWAGLALFVAGVGLKTALPAAIVAWFAVALFGSLCVYTAFVYP
jgi:hypothetical protein